MGKKVYLYYTIYDVTDETGYPFLEEPELYAFSEDKQLAKQFEATRYMPAFIKVVKRKEEFTPNYKTFLAENWTSQIIDLPIPVNDEDDTSIAGTYMEDQSLSEQCELLQYDIDSFQSTLQELYEKGILTDLAYEDLSTLLNYQSDKGTTFNVFHIFYHAFRRTLLPKKIWMAMDHGKYDE